MYDVHSGQPRPTLLAKLVRQLAHGKSLEHPVLQSLGWWQRPGRVQFQPSIASVQPRVLKAVKQRAKAMSVSRDDESEDLEYAA